jgi:hypothetical protein
MGFGLAGWFTTWLGLDLVMDWLVMDRVCFVHSWSFYDWQRVC